MLSSIQHGKRKKVMKQGWSSRFGSLNRCSLACGLALSFVALPARSAEDLSFDLNITLSSKATAKLKSAREGITVWASYYGEPKAGAERHADELGMIDLGTETFQLPGAPGVAHITGRQVGVEKLQWVDGSAKVNVNIYTSRKASEYNLLECDLVDGEVKLVKAKPITAHCSLIEEHLESKTYP